MELIYNHYPIVERILYNVYMSEEQNLTNLLNAYPKLKRYVEYLRISNNNAYLLNNSDNIAENEINLPMLKYLYCYQCNTIENLSSFIDLTILDCSNCSLINNVSTLTNLTELYCHNCSITTDLTTLPNLRFIHN